MSDLINQPDPVLQGDELPTFRFALEQSEGKTLGGSYGKEATVKQLPISKWIAGVSMRLEPGVMRELHWHPNADEWQYVIAGRVRVTLFGAHGRWRQETLDKGDVGYVPTGYGHSIENDSDEKPARLLVAFNTGHYEAIDLSLWLAANPEYLLAANLGVPMSLIEKLPRHRVFIATKDGPEQHPPPQAPEGLR